MPRLPVAEDLGVRLPQNRGQVVTPSAPAELQAQRQLLNGLEEFGQNLTARRDQMQAHKARIGYQKAVIQAESIYTNADPDADLGALAKQHNEILQKARSESLGGIENAQIRETLGQDFSLSELQSMERGKGKLLALAKDRDVADMNQILSDARELAITGDFNRAMQVSNEAIATARNNGSINDTQEQAIRQKYGRETAVATVTSKPYAEQKRLLTTDNPLSKIIPTDVKKSMLLNINGKLVLEQATAKADEIRLDGGDRETRLEKVRKIKDADVRKAAQAQVEHDLAQEKTGLLETQNDAYQTLAKEVIAGKSSAQVILENPQAWDSMTAEQQVAVKSLDAKGRKTDLAFYHKLNLEYADDPRKAYDLFLEGAHKLSEGEFKEWSDRFAKGLAAEPDPLFSLGAEFNAVAKDLKIKDEDKGKARIRLKEEYETWRLANPGKKMSAKDQQEIISSVFDWATDTFLGIPFGKTYQFELPRNEVSRRKIEKMAQEFEQYYGRAPSDQDMIRIRDKMVRDGMIPEYRGSTSE